MSVKPGTGDATKHSINKQWERGPGATNVPLKKSTANPPPLGISKPTEGKPQKHGVPMAPKINEGAIGPDGQKRIIQSEGRPAGRDAAVGKSTFRAPRKDSSSHDPLLAGYTKPGKM
jgi:hypothetical protein